MKTVVDDQFRREVKVFALAFTCDACAAFDPDPRLCAYGYPTEPHRAVALERAEEVIFCKAFEAA